VTGPAPEERDFPDGTDGSPEPAPAAIPVLLAEDDPLMREFLAAVLSSLGYAVTVAANGREALDILERSPISLVLTDWMMPEVDGAELCRRVRARRSEQYTYIVLLTGRQDSAALVEGMEAGADDFLTKPPDVNELRVRLRAGERVLRLQRQLARRNRKLELANQRIREAYGRIERDLVAAASAQRRLLPRPGGLDGLSYDWLFLPSSHVGGDTFNVVQRDGSSVAFYQIDVAGHGVPAALMSFTLQRVLSGTSLGIGPADAPPRWDDPTRIVGELNRRFQADEEDTTYFTMLYGVLDTRSGEVRLTQAGHPSPIHAAREGPVGMIGEGGPVVGLFPDPGYETVSLRMGLGDRLVLYSDGVVECENPEGEAFSEERLMAVAGETLAVPLDGALAELNRRLEAWRGAPAYDDDVSVLVIERTGGEAEDGHDERYDGADRGEGRG
jgi:sigma-B regulation protein RsbU (phosphoserine phosphatase)